MKQAHFNRLQRPGPRVHRGLADVAAQHIGHRYIRERLPEGPRNCVFNQAFAQSNPQITSEQLYQVLRFQRGGLNKNPGQHVDLYFFATRGTQSRQQHFGVAQSETRQVARPGFGKDLKGDVSGVAPARITRPECFRCDSGSEAHRLAENAAADIGGANITLRELLAGEITCGAGEVVITQVLEIFTEEPRLFQLFGGRSYSFSCARELLKRVVWNSRILNHLSISL